MEFETLNQAVNYISRNPEVIYIPVLIGMALFGGIRRIINLPKTLEGLTKNPENPIRKP